MGPVLLIMGIGTALGLLGVGMAPGDYAGLMKEMTSLPFTILFGVLALLAGFATLMRKALSETVLVRERTVNCAI
jgi:hypothetical protein